jgi:trimeric autotransporter adhesin
MSIRRSQDERIEGTPDGVNAITAISDLPNAPTAISATNVGTSRAYNNGAATVTITPDTAGGTPSSYTVTSSPGSFTGSGTSPVTVTGLQSATSYTFTATATNSTGTSGASPASSSITATTVPQAPTIGAATATGVTTATVAFTAGATGGSAITTFTATSSPGSVTGTSATSPISMTGLSGGTAYTFTVTATNANGTSTASAASTSITTSSVNAFLAGGGGSGGGFNNIIRKMPKPTEVFSAISATTTYNVSDPAPVSNGSVAGYWLGGYVGGGAWSGSGGNGIDKLTAATEARSTLAATLSVRKYNLGAVSNVGVAGYVSGGLRDDTTYGNTTDIQKLTYSTEARTTLAATVTDAAGYQSCYNVQNPGVAGYILRRDNTTVEKLNFSTEATSLLGNTRTNNTYNAMGFSNGSTAGYIVGGFSTAGQGYPRGGDKLNFSNETWSYISNVLSAYYNPSYGTGGRYNGGSFAFAGSAGYMVGGYAEGFPDFTDKLTFSTDTPSLLGQGSTIFGTGTSTLNGAKGFALE